MPNSLPAPKLSDSAEHMFVMLHRRDSSHSPQTRVLQGSQAFTWEPSTPGGLWFLVLVLESLRKESIIWNIGETP